MTPNLPTVIDETTWWQTLRHLSRRLGKLMLTYCLLLYFTARAPTTPLWVKALALSALAYLVTPIDAIPDPLPLGLSDDTALLSLALAKISRFIDHAIREQANAVLQRFFH